MPWETVGVLVTSGIGLIGVWLQVQHHYYRGRRKKIKEDLELLALLPEGSVARKPLIDHIDSAILQGIKDESELRRDAGGIGIAIFLLAVALTAGVFAISSGAWWWWALAAVLGLVGAFGLSESVALRKRDESGKILGSSGSK